MLLLLRSIILFGAVLGHPLEFVLFLAVSGRLLVVRGIHVLDILLATAVFLFVAGLVWRGLSFLAHAFAELGEADMAVRIVVAPT